MTIARDLEAEDFDTLDVILADMRTRLNETPDWEFCEGFMAALVCCRRSIPVDEWLPVLLGIDEGGCFADDAQRERFLTLWQRREDAVRTALDADIQTLCDDNAYLPEVMDVRAAVALLPPEERAQIKDEDIPSFAQVWALGFMYFVENWPEEWEPPKNKDAAKWHNAALEAIVTLVEDDTEEATLSVHSESSLPSVSQKRIDAYGHALWAVYDLRQIWRHIGPRVLQVIHNKILGRNDPCFCGSGRKYKKCCGA